MEIHIKLTAHPPACLAALAALAMLLAGCGSAGGRPLPSPLQSARSFLDRYVAPNGRVIRADQGGDTVSEGQAYALLLSEATGRLRTFDQVWSWTSAHLLEPDGLLAYHANATRVLDGNPASDADLLAAWALTRYRGPRQGSYRLAGKRLANAILTHELAYPAPAKPLLAAGPWATPLPAIVDPSYLALPAFAKLEETVPDGRWHALSEDALSLSSSLTEQGRLLPPDWAMVQQGGSASPIRAPNGGASEVQYGLDAQRLIVWLASSCEAQARSLAASFWPLLKPPARSAAIALSLQGDVIDRNVAPLPLIASAAAAGAAGHLHRREALLAEAQRTSERFPTYYGSAWAALGRILLSTNRLGGCGQASAG